MSEPLNYPAFDEDLPLEHSTGAVSPVAGKTYSGPIVAINDKYLVQDVGSEQRLVRHSRQELHGSAIASLASGARVDIRYPANHVGVVSEWAATPVRSGAAKGLEPKGFGE